MKTRKLFVLVNCVWDANDYLNGRNGDPRWTDTYLYNTREEAEQKAASLDVYPDRYNDGAIMAAEVEEQDILRVSGYETIEEWDEAMAEPYSTDPNRKNLGETEKGRVAGIILEDPTEQIDVQCANYDFHRSLEGAILVLWSWERHIGYARRFRELRRATADDTEALLTRQDKVGAIQCDVLLTADEAAQAGEDWQQAASERLAARSWKWTNPSDVAEAVGEHR